MIYLTRSALKYAANICEELPNYKVGIVIPEMAASKNLVDIIGMNMKDNNADFRITNNQCVIVFSNGSCIDVFSARENCRGKRVHLLIADRTINEELISAVFRPFEIYDYYRQFPETEREFKNGD